MRVAGIAKKSAALVGAISGGDVATLGVRGEVKDVAVSARAKQHRITRMAANLAGHHVPDDDAFGVPVDHHQIEHFRAGKHLDLAGSNLARTEAW